MWGGEGGYSKCGKRGGSGIIKEPWKGGERAGDGGSGMGDVKSMKGKMYKEVV